MNEVERTTAAHIAAQSAYDTAAALGRIVKDCEAAVAEAKERPALRIAAMVAGDNAPATLSVAGSEADLLAANDAQKVAAENRKTLAEALSQAARNKQRAEIAAHAQTAVAALAGRGLTIEIHGTDIHTARLTADPSFVVSDLADLNALVDHVANSQRWPHGRDAALAQLNRLAKKAAA